jgi:hypothetical protein
MISYWARLLTGKETKLSYLSYKILYNLFIDENLDFSWIKHVKHIFDDTFTEIWVTMPQQISIKAEQVGDLILI